MMFMYAVESFDLFDLILDHFGVAGFLQTCADEHVIFGGVFGRYEFEQLGGVTAAF